MKENYIYPAKFEKVDDVIEVSFWISSCKNLWRKS